jgi:hypothetical protein
LGVFPNGRWDDLNDAFVHFLRRITLKGARWTESTIKELVESMDSGGSYE